MPIEQAKVLLEPMVPTLLDCFWQGWEWASGWVDGNELARTILHSSTFSGIVSDAFGHFSRQPLTDEFHARWRESGRFRRATIGQSLSLRFKKLTPDLLSMNVKTESQRAIYEQDEAVLPNAIPITQITLDYTLNSIASNVTGIYFTCPVNFDQNAWIWPIYQQGNQQLSLFAGEPLPPGDVVEDVLDVTIKMKKRGKAEQG